MTVYQTQTETKKTERLGRAVRRQLQRQARKTTPDGLRSELKGGLMEMGVGLALEQVQKMMEEDADILAGAPKGVHSNQRKGERNGTANGYVVVGGKKIAIRRPRLRAIDGGGEISLPSYKWAQDPEGLLAVALDTMILGVATRSHRRMLDRLAATGEDVVVRGLSKSAISRRFVLAGEQALQTICSRRLDGTRWLVLYLDGVQEGGHHAIAAMGINESGKKHILGLWNGASENAAVVRELLEDLLARGLDVSHGLLVVMDGSKALAAAVREVFGDRVLIQRCRVHKRRNVLEKLPEKEQDWMKRKLGDAWRAGNAGQIRADLEALADLLKHKGRHEAAASLREGLAETLTCHRLGVRPCLMPTVTNTNALESVFSRHESCSYRVKRWRNGRQLMRWVAVGMLEAEASLQPVEHPEALRHLAQCLSAHAAGRATPGSMASGVA